MSNRFGSAPPRQLAFDLPLDPGFGREDFLVSPSNDQAYGLIEAWPAWPNPIMLLKGPPGSGKSHLASIWAAEAGARLVPGEDIKSDQVPVLASGSSLVIENPDRTACDEAALFHLLNLARERGMFLLMTCGSRPDGWGLKTPDLLSRLRLAPVTELDAPDDALLKAVLVKLFVDRQLVVDTSVVDYIALRIERSLARAAEVVALLDKEALSRGRRVSRHMAAELFGTHDITDNE